MAGKPVSQNVGLLGTPGICPFQALISTNVHIPPESRAGGIWTSLPELAGEGWLAVPFLTDTWEPWLLVNPIPCQAISPNGD